MHGCMWWPCSPACLCCDSGRCPCPGKCRNGQAQRSKGQSRHNLHTSLLLGQQTPSGTCNGCHCLHSSVCCIPPRLWRFQSSRRHRVEVHCRCVSGFASPQRTVSSKSPTHCTTPKSHERGKARSRCTCRYHWHCLRSPCRPTVVQGCRRHACACACRYRMWLSTGPSCHMTPTGR